MGRPRKLASAELIKIVDAFFAEKVQGDPSMLKCSNIGRFAKTKGYDVEAYHFRRDERVQQRLLELRESLDLPLFDSEIAAYKGLDVDSLLASCGSLDQLKRCLLEIDTYWRENYQKFAGVAAKYRILLQESSTIRGETEQAQRALKEAMEQTSTLQRELSRLDRENRYLRRTIRETLYPALADELLRNNHFPVAENTALRPDVLEKMIEGDIPSAFDGIQAYSTPPKNRQQRLLEELERQVDVDV